MITLLWSYETIFRSFQRRSGQGQKNGQIFKLINVDKKAAILTSFCQESNGVICFYLRPPEVTKIVFEKVSS